MFCNLNEKDQFTQKTVRNLVKKGFCESKQDAIRLIREKFPELNREWQEWNGHLIMRFPNTYYVLTFFG